MSIRHLISLAHLSAEDLACLVDRSVDFAKMNGRGTKPLSGEIVGIYFTKPSTRTRTSYTVAALKLGAQTVTYGADDLQITTGETIGDTVRVLSGYINALVIRTNGAFEEIATWADQDEIAIVNAMSANEHPTQAIADLSTIKEALGRLSDVHLLYLGEGNNTAAALALAAAQTPGMMVTFVTPSGYGLEEPILEQACRVARRNGGLIEHHHDMEKLPRNVDVVYTTRWETMGESHTDPHWRETFAPYSVTPAVMAQVSRPSGTILLHDLPAVRGQDISDEVLNGPQSLAWRQAHYKMYSAMATLEWCFKRCS